MIRFQSQFPTDLVYSAQISRNLITGENDEVIFSKYFHWRITFFCVNLSIHFLFHQTSNSLVAIVAATFSWHAYLKKQDPTQEKRFKQIAFIDERRTKNNEHDEFSQAFKVESNLWANPSRKWKPLFHAVWLKYWLCKYFEQCQNSWPSDFQKKKNVQNIKFFIWIRS